MLLNQPTVKQHFLAKKEREKTKSTAGKQNRAYQ
jgi:hypothetical protein